MSKLSYAREVLEPRSSPVRIVLYRFMNQDMSTLFSTSSIMLRQLI